jgi:hypothetical protein
MPFLGLTTYDRTILIVPRIIPLLTSEDKYWGGYEFI